MKAKRKRIPCGLDMTILALGTAAFMALASSASAGSTQFVSTRNPLVAPSAAGNDNSDAPILTPDGRFVIFTSVANNLVPGDNNLFGSGVFLRDRSSNTTVLVSANFSGTGRANAHATADGISTNGQFVLFDSAATDLVPGVTNGVDNIYVRDMLAGTNILVTVGMGGALADNNSWEAAMSPDGRFVVFASAADNLVAGDTNTMPDVFVRDLINQTTTLVSVGAVATTNSSVVRNVVDTPVMTPDGRYVAFFSNAGGLAAGVSPTTPGEIYLRDLQAGLTTWISSNVVALDGVIGSAPSTHPRVSDDGRYVIFKVGSTNGGNFSNLLLLNDSTTASNTVITNNVFQSWPYAEDKYGPEITPDGRFIAYVAAPGTSVNAANSSVHVWDVQNMIDTIVSVNLLDAIPTNTLSDTPVITPDGRFVAFQSTATNLVTNTVTADVHSYLRDLQGGVTTLLDVDTNGVGSVDNTGNLTSLSADGQFAAFCSPNDSLVAFDSNHYFDVFVRDINNAVTELVSVRDTSFISQAGRGLSIVGPTSLSSNGQWLAFSSQADDLVTNDFNGDQDVFIRDMVNGTNALVSVGMDGNSALGGYSTGPVISADGRYVVFASAATNIVANDTKNVADIFRRDLQTGTTVQVSIGTNGLPLTSDSSSPSISADGRYVVFQNLGTPTTTANFLLRDVNSGVTLVSLVGTPNIPPSLSSDGRYIAYCNSHSNLLVWDTQLSANIYSNTSIVTSQSISPGGNAVLYVSANKLIVTSLATSSNLFSIATGVSIQSSAQWSADGRFCAFVTATNAAPGDNNGTNDVYLLDTQTGTVTLISLNFSHTGSAAGASDSPVLSGDGRFVVFRSFAPDIVSVMANTNVPNLYVFDRLTGSNSLVNVESSDSSWNPWIAKPAISSDGSTIAYQSMRGALVPGTLDLNRIQDAFAAPQSPFVAVDSDGDGIPDWWMMQYFGHPTGQAADNSRAQDDADGDGMSNLQEFLAGTNPTDPNSVFRIQPSQVLLPNAVQFSWPTLPGKNFQVQYKLNITDPWQNFPGNVWVMENTAYFTTPIVGTQVSAFYQVVEVD